MNSHLIKKVKSEIEKPKFDTTKQYLKAFEIEFHKGKPIIQLIEEEVYKDINVVFTKVKEVPFFLAFSFSKQNFDLIGTYVENANQIYFTATSKTKTFEELAEMTKLKDLKGWSVNQLRPNGKSKFNFSRITYEPIKNRAYDYETKLNRLLDDLKSDLDGIKKITESADTIISIHRQMYISGNFGFCLNKNTVKSLNELNLGIDIDQYVYCNEIE